MRFANGVSAATAGSAERASRPPAREQTVKPQAFSTVPARYEPMTVYTATVTVRLKRVVLDPEAETTQRSLERLGFELEDLRSADQFEVDLDAADRSSAEQRVTEMTERLLANPTIHDYEVAVAEREL